ncbi:phosphoribosyltransferase [Erythrobacter insulae]|uniref:Phosphoribosyltransferase n=1 Tax=Erythrobacter insulae TaxID=2584124 RepID=A0A547PBV6_9SPHN|nr:phosphoribosyltransferase family protein [Erythrobacter insulae]TRD11623.1 phosphoribosyltransferase [Erythrobacter insulae]
MAEFADRQDAGRQLAQALLELDLPDPVVLALPRGGVPLGFEIAKELDAPLDLIMVRKIGAPGHAEFGIGAVADGTDPYVVIDKDMAQAVGADLAYLQRVLEQNIAEIGRRRIAYGIEHPVPLKGRTAIVVDDGIATGNTVKAALKAIARASPARVILAVPVAAQDTLTKIRPLCDQIICLHAPRAFQSVGVHYADFGQITDAQVVTLLNRVRRSKGVVPN